MEPASDSIVERGGLSWSASLLSLVIHLTLLLIVALWIPAGSPPGGDEGDREVGIVLVRRSDDRQDDPRDAETEPTREETQVSAQPSASSQRADSVADALPSAASPASRLIPDVDLPGPLPGMLPSQDLLLPELTLGGPGRRPILPGSDEEAVLAEAAARRAAREALGPATSISVFGSSPATGRSFVFAIDRSKSMGGSGLNALAAARDELARSLAQLTPKHRIQVIAYSHTCVYYPSPRLTSATPDVIAGVSRFIDELNAFGGTDHEMAVRAALASEPDAVFLLTDGGDPHLNEIQLKNLQKLAEGRAKIHCIQFGFGVPAEGDSFMARLASQNGGSHTYVDMAR